MVTSVWQDTLKAPSLVELEPVVEDSSPLSVVGVVLSSLSLSLPQLVVKSPVINNVTKDLFIIGFGLPFPFSFAFFRFFGSSRGKVKPRLLDFSGLGIAKIPVICF